MGYILTGSIATGKSSVSKILDSKGFKIIDADKIAREIIEPEIIEELFGDEYITDGFIDRKKLAQLIFNDKEEKRKLENYLHPLIEQEINKEREKYQKRGEIFFIDIPLFFETKQRYDKDEGVVLVYTPKELQLQRLIRRDRLSQADAIKRVDSQIDIEKKREFADFVIDNSKDLKHLKKEVEDFISKIKRNMYANI